MQEKKRVPKNFMTQLKEKRLEIEEFLHLTDLKNEAIESICEIETEIDSTLQRIQENEILRQAGIQDISENLARVECIVKDTMKSSDKFRDFIEWESVQEAGSKVQENYRHLRRLSCGHCDVQMFMSARQISIHVHAIYKRVSKLEKRIIETLTLPDPTELDSVHVDLDKVISFLDDGLHSDDNLDPYLDVDTYFQILKIKRLVFNILESELSSALETKFTQPKNPEIYIDLDTLEYDVAFPEEFRSQRQRYIDCAAASRSNRHFIASLFSSFSGMLQDTMKSVMSEQDARVQLRDENLFYETKAKIDQTYLKLRLLTIYGSDLSQRERQELVKKFNDAKSNAHRAHIIKNLKRSVQKPSESTQELPSGSVCTSAANLAVDLS
jgi:archaellum component FlaC